VFNHVTLRNQQGIQPDCRKEIKQLTPSSQGHDSHAQERFSHPPWKIFYTIQRCDESCIWPKEVGAYLSDEIRQGPQKHDDEQRYDSNEILPSVVDQDADGLGSIAERIDGSGTERVHLLTVEVD